MAVRHLAIFQIKPSVTALLDQLLLYKGIQKALLSHESSALLTLILSLFISSLFISPLFISLTKPHTDFLHTSMRDIHTVKDPIGLLESYC